MVRVCGFITETPLFKLDSMTEKYGQRAKEIILQCDKHQLVDVTDHWRLRKSFQ